MLAETEAEGGNNLEAGETTDDLFRHAKNETHMPVSPHHGPWWMNHGRHLYPKVLFIFIHDSLQKRATPAFSSVH